MKHKKLAEQAGLITNQDTEENNQEYLEDIERFAELVRQDEREACAALCDDWFAGTAGQAIRERGNK